MQIKTSLQVLTLQRETDKVLSFNFLFLFCYLQLCYLLSDNEISGWNYIKWKLNGIHMAHIGHGEAAENSFPSEFCPLTWWFSHDDDCCCLQKGRLKLCRSLSLCSSTYLWYSAVTQLISSSNLFFCRSPWFILDTCLWCGQNECDPQRKVCWTIRCTDSRGCEYFQIFGTHASIQKITSLFHQAALNMQLLEGFEKSFPTLNFPPLPDRGDFDLKEVLESPYFFN